MTSATSPLDGIVQAAQASTAGAATTPPPSAPAAPDSGIAASAATLTNAKSRVPSTLKNSDDASLEIENPPAVTMKISTAAAATTIPQQTSATAVLVPDGVVVPVKSTGVENANNTLAPNNDGQAIKIEIPANPLPFSFSNGPVIAAPAPATATSAPATAASASATAAPAPAAAASASATTPPAAPVLQTTDIAQAIKAATDAALASMRLEMEAQMKKMQAEHQNELDDAQIELAAARTATAELSATANSIASAAQKSQIDRDEREAASAQQLLDLQADNLRTKSLLARETVIAVSLQTRLDQQPPFTSATSSLASGTSATSATIHASTAAALQAKLQAFLAAEATATARADASADVDARAKLVQDTADGIQRKKDSEAAKQQKLEDERLAAVALAAKEQQNREQAALEQAALDQQNRLVALNKHEQDALAAQHALESRYHAEQAQLAARLQQQRADLGLDTTGKTTGYSAMAARPASTSTATSSTTSSAAGAASHSAAFMAHATPPATAPTPAARTSVKILVKLRAWSGAADRLGFPEWLKDVVSFVRKNHANHHDCVLWVDAYKMPSKVHGFMVNTLLEKLRGVQWALLKLKALVTTLNCGSLERLPLNAMLKCIQDACLNTTVGLLASGSVGPQVLLHLSLENVKLPPPAHIENLEMAFQSAKQANDDIMDELALSTDPEHGRAITKYQAKLDWREIARNLTREFHRITELQPFALTLTDAAAKCSSADDITALLTLASSNASSYSTSAKPAPSMRATNADDTDAANMTTDAQDGFRLEKRAAKKAAKATNTAANKAKATALLKSKKDWTTAERAIVLKMNTQDATFTRETDRCPSCNKTTCPPGKCRTSKGYQRWKQKTGNTDDTTNSSASRERPKFDKGTCYDFQNGRCHRGDACKYSHDATSGRKTTGNDGHHGSELEQLRKANAELKKKYTATKTGALDLAQMLALKDPTLVAKAQEALGQSLQERNIAFLVSLNKATADDH